MTEEDALKVVLVLMLVPGAKIAMLLTGAKIKLIFTFEANC